MTRKEAKAEKEPLKKHGDAMEKAMADADRHTAEGKRADPVPMPENGAHERSHARIWSPAGAKRMSTPNRRWT